MSAAGCAPPPGSASECHSVCTAFRKPVTAVWGRREVHLNIPNLIVIACTLTPSQRPYSAYTTLPRRHYSVYEADRALTQRTYIVLTAIIAFKIFFTFSYFEQPYFANIVIYFYCLKPFVFNSC